LKKSVSFRLRDRDAVERDKIVVAFELFHWRQHTLVGFFGQCVNALLCYIICLERGDFPRSLGRQAFGKWFDTSVKDGRSHERSIPRLQSFDAFSCCMLSRLILAAGDMCAGRLRI
jgi:hypothetical protein